MEAGDGVDAEEVFGTGAVDWSDDEAWGETGELVVDHVVDGCLRTSVTYEISCDLLRYCHI